MFATEGLVVDRQSLLKQRFGARVIAFDTVQGREPEQQIAEERLIRLYFVLCEIERGLCEREGAVVLSLVFERGRLSAELVSLELGAIFAGGPVEWTRRFDIAQPAISDSGLSP